MNALSYVDRPLVAIVDDEEDIVTYLEMALQDNGFRVVTASDAEQALALMAASPPDVICLDLLMPRQTGLALYSRILADPKLSGRPIIIMSGLTESRELPGILARAGGLPEPACFLEKPIGIDELLRVLEGLVPRVAYGMQS